MINRVLVMLAALAAACGGGFVVAAAGADDRQRYTVVLDNAFGLTEGSDLRSAGVKIGKVEELDVERKTARALATIVVDRPDFAGLRKDVFCEIKPQSLIGEYFMDCRPGTSREPAPKRIEVEQTAGTIAPDLVLDILRRPARERFGLILSELGGGLAARGEDLQTTIRRGVPALRETDKVLDILHANRRTLRDLADEADEVLVKLAGNRDDVARFVSEARHTTAASADRRDELAATVRRLPGFLRELRPALRDLGAAATLQTPALADLRGAAPDLTTLLRRLGPFSDSARPAVRSLGEASQTGIDAAREARSTVSELRRLGTRSTEPARNLRFFLEDIDDRERAVEPNKLSPTGRGFTGIEAFLQYLFVQSQAINIFDSKGYMLKLSLLVNNCSKYINAETARTDAELTDQCNQWLGPSQPGITTAGARKGSNSEAVAPKRDDRAGVPSAAAPSAPAAPQQPAPAPSGTGGLLDDLLDKLPKLPLGPSKAGSAKSEQNLLDFLLGP
ncbi:MAG: MlaD family protein [Actinomycetota bacterium]|nr:MlaD family protein [Actinomycetota bacterium]